MKNLRADHPWLVRIVKTVLVAIGITAFLLAIAQDQETVKVRSAVAAEDPDAADYLATLVASNLVAGNSYEVLVNGDQAFPAMLDESASKLSFTKTDRWPTSSLMPSRRPRGAASPSTSSSTRWEPAVSIPIT
jgi:hypothetical protein